MKRINGGSAVKGGYYWNLSNWEIAAVSGDTGVLPMPADQQFVAMPTPALLVIAPIMGAAYAFFLPFIGFALASYALVKKLGLAGKGAVEDMAATVGQQWVPGEAHFTGKPAEPKAEVPAAHPLDKLQREIEALRKSEM